AQPMYIAPAPPPTEAKPADASPTPVQGTEADKLRLQYKSVGEAQNHNYGDNPPGSKAVDFTHLGSSPAPAPAAGKPAGMETKPGPATAPPPPGGTPPAPDARRPNPAGGGAPGGRIR